ncbi:ribosomal protein S11 [Candidatus Carsonella ruddii PV]|uniref:Small ribosomal subunit protein uS11 n=1 Tax=Carsonella ruddii (strain PV) TaxID=387662 RepID=RS11_CARRP|nr:30S ribosomal protein S11 [Candidatus Carsonella ruddii]Q05FK3.1 RecName: Full=Small ribosomal subunit protein uS11; AltName: Full=30S ribosomal protein S11 [Candidatus Carsonella ruddii PV]BAF35168.1 ribosomal protein S11 [Candidatus Carsonella ruddii PV]
MKLYKKRGIIYIHSTFNNTISTLTDVFGNTIVWYSAGILGYKGPKKSTSLASQLISEKITISILKNNIKVVDIYIKGLGLGKETTLRIINNSGIFIRSITDITPIPHNGCRKKKKRRV